MSQHTRKKKRRGKKNTSKSIKSLNVVKRGNKSKKKVFSNKEYNSNDGMLTSVWGPAMWHYLHAMSFNYPVNPTGNEKKHYKNFILSLKNVLPCKYCRINLKNNFKQYPLKKCHLMNRESFSKYVYKLHEIVNNMLNKTSNITYEKARDTYEHFRSRCTQGKKNSQDY